ncbi:287_t:CDS:2 [Acaulospora colombiana]|uniref:287_t:CDS:1 n=1 Tax=Acaulospora colombiana TaxID=27376 RepID=A0ACA9NMS5_9GLOM|nr:287_t:CDS:2 [Acaulospora colombiana]
MIFDPIQRWMRTVVHTPDMAAARRERISGIKSVSWGSDREQLCCTVWFVVVVVRAKQFCSRQPLTSLTNLNNKHGQINRIVTCSTNDDHENASTSLLPLAVCKLCSLIVVHLPEPAPAPLGLQLAMRLARQDQYVLSVCALTTLFWVEPVTAVAEVGDARSKTLIVRSEEQVASRFP